MNSHHSTGKILIMRRESFDYLGGSVKNIEATFELSRSHDFSPMMPSLAETPGYFMKDFFLHKG
jgi:hypothetical protein